MEISNTDIDKLKKYDIQVLMSVVEFCACICDAVADKYDSVHFVERANGADSCASAIREIIKRMKEKV